MSQLQRFGYKSEILIRRSLFISKNLYLNSYTIPFCKKIRINLPLYEPEKFLRCRSILIFLEFLEQITGLKPFIKDVMLIIGSGLWVNCQVNLSSWFLQRFIGFLNEFILSHPLIRFSEKLPVLKYVDQNYIKLIIYDLHIFFDTSTSKSLPNTKLFWLECNFFFDNLSTNGFSKNNLSTTFYLQSFLNINFLN